jgi:hypothetical protein
MTALAILRPKLRATLSVPPEAVSFSVAQLVTINMPAATASALIAADNPTRLGALFYFPALASKYF